MACRVIKISELAQLIIDCLVQISPESVVSLACTCKALEEQALSALWSDQDSLQRLVQCTLSVDKPSLPLSQQKVRDIMADASLVPDRGRFLGVSSPQRKRGIGSGSMRP